MQCVVLVYCISSCKDCSISAPAPCFSISIQLDWRVQPLIVGGAATVLDLVSLSSSPLAKCNDGSTAVYYRPQGSSEEAGSKWMIYLKGGGYCVPGSPLTDITVRQAGWNFSQLTLNISELQHQMCHWTWSMHRFDMFILNSKYLIISKYFKIFQNISLPSLHWSWSRPRRVWAGR